MSKATQELIKKALNVNKLRDYCGCGCDCPTCHHGRGEQGTTNPKNCYYCQKKWLKIGEYARLQQELYKKVKTIETKNTIKNKCKHKWTFMKKTEGNYTGILTDPHPIYHLFYCSKCLKYKLKQIGQTFLI